jgi:RNA-directed DNA polymerase
MPKEGGQGGRVLSIPTRRARVVQGAFTLILEPILEADCPPGAYGYRPTRAAPAAVLRVAEAIVQDKPRVIAVALQASVDPIRPPLRVAPGAPRGNDPDGLHVLKLRRHASGKKGVAPGGGLSALRSKL